MTTIQIYLTTLTLDTLQFSPFFDRLGQIDLAQWNLDFTDLIVFGEPVEVEDRENESFIHRIRIRYALENKYVPRSFFEKI